METLSIYYGTPYLVPVKPPDMTKNNTLRLVLLALCLAAVVTSVTSCDKNIGKPVGNTPGVPQERFDTLFSRIKFFKDGRKPGTDTVWTLRLTTHELVVKYQSMDGYVYAEAATYTDMGVWYLKRLD